VRVLKVRASSTNGSAYSSVSKVKVSSINGSVVFAEEIANSLVSKGLLVSTGS
jgi:hypothetical protein